MYYIIIEIFIFYKRHRRSLAIKPMKIELCLTKSQYFLIQIYFIIFHISLSVFVNNNLN